MRWLLGLVMGVGLVQLGLLRQGRAGCAGFQFLQQWDRLVILAVVHGVPGVRIDGVRAHAGCLVNSGRGASRQADRRGHKCHGINSR